MKLFEVFDSPYPFDVDYKGKEVYYYFTTDNGIPYKIGFKSIKTQAGETATVAFGLTDTKMNLFKDKNKDRELGNSFRVLGTVVAAMRRLSGTASWSSGIPFLYRQEYRYQRSSKVSTTR